MTIRLWGNAFATVVPSGGTSVVSLQNGGYVVAWHEGAVGARVVKFQIFTATGEPTGPVVTTPSSGEQTNPSISVLADGNIYITQQDFDTTIDHDIDGYVYSPTGAFIRNAFVENSSLNQTDPFAIASGGSTALVTYTQGLAGSTSIYSRSVDTATGIAGPAVSVNGVGADVRDPEIAFHPISGTYLAYYGDYSTFGAARLMARSVTATSVGFEFQINQNFYYGGATAVAVSNTVFAFIYGVDRDPTPGNLVKPSIALRIVSANGFIDQPEVILAGTDYDDALKPDVELLPNGDILVCWLEGSLQGGSIWMQQFRSSGIPVSGPQLVADPHTAGALITDYTMALLNDGRVVLSWTEKNGSNEVASVTQIVDPRDGVYNGDAAANIAYGNETVGDTMNGLAGNDTLYGLAGADVIYGGNGLDTLYGGRGDDTLYGGADRDTIYGELGDDELYGEAGPDLMYGGAGYDKLVGGADNDSLYAESDDDTLIGGGGMDYLDGGSGFDFASYETSTLGIRVDTVFRSGNTNDAVGDTFVNIEGLIGSNFADFLTVTYGDDTVYGLAGDDYIDARSGNDKLFGGAGYDQLYGGDGDDILEGGANNDYLDGGNGTDTASYATATAGVVVFMNNSGGGLNDGAGDIFYQVENLTGSLFNDQLNGDDAANVISGGNGDDLLVGGGGADTLLGGQGTDTLEGGTGNDIMDGGIDSDVFRFTTINFGQDRIDNFQDGIDFFVTEFAGLAFSDFTITQVGADTLMTVTSSPTNTITLTNFTASNITAADFLTGTGN
jgi:Ca2+-binding RTX toxin-like protein